MADKKFEAILTLLVPQIINLVCENYPMDEMEASREFYESKVYSLLEQEDTKLWHFSPLTLFICMMRKKEQEISKYRRMCNDEQRREISHLLCGNL